VKTVGVVVEITEKGLIKIAKPVGNGLSEIRWMHS
jgi:hypothetical protein